MTHPERIEALEMETGIDANDVSSLCTQLSAAGDEAMAQVCERALTGDRAAWLRCAEALADGKAS